jgi:hypothetical protein
MANGNGSGYTLLSLVAGTVVLRAWATPIDSWLVTPDHTIDFRVAVIGPVQVVPTYVVSDIRGAANDPADIKQPFAPEFYSVPAVAVSDNDVLIAIIDDVSPSQGSADIFAIIATPAS